jgi:hypothetical protein
VTLPRGFGNSTDSNYRGYGARCPNAKCNRRLSRGVCINHSCELSPRFRPSIISQLISLLKK